MTPSAPSQNTHSLVCANCRRSVRVRAELLEDGRVVKATGYCHSHAHAAGTLVERHARATGRDVILRVVDLGRGVKVGV